jgi:hypothetical protein
MLPGLALHYTILITWTYTTLHYTTLAGLILHYTTLPGFTLQYITLPGLTLHYTTWTHTTLHNTSIINVLQSDWMSECYITPSEQVFNLTIPRTGTV